MRWRAIRRTLRNDVSSHSAELVSLWIIDKALVARLRITTRSGGAHRVLKAHTHGKGRKHSMLYVLNRVRGCRGARNFEYSKSLSWCMSMWVGLCMIVTEATLKRYHYRIQHDHDSSILRDMPEDMSTFPMGEHKSEGVPERYT